LNFPLLIVPVEVCKTAGLVADARVIRQASDSGNAALMLSPIVTE
jgi:hypothetical protein